VVAARICRLRRSTSLLTSASSARVRHDQSNQRAQRSHQNQAQRDGPRQHGAVAPNGWLARLIGIFISIVPGDGPQIPSTPRYSLRARQRRPECSVVTPSSLWNRRSARRCARRTRTASTFRRPPRLSSRTRRWAPTPPRHPLTRSMQLRQRVNFSVPLSAPAREHAPADLRHHAQPASSANSRAAMEDVVTRPDSSRRAKRRLVARHDLDRRHHTTTSTFLSAAGCTE